MNEKLSVRLDREARAWADCNAEHPDNQSPTTEALLYEAAALALRVEGAPVAEVSAGYGGPCAAFAWSESDDEAMSGMISQRVALVPVEGGA